MSRRIDDLAGMAGHLFVDAFLITLSFYVVRSWVRWFRSDVKWDKPRWRAALATLGFAAGTVSLAIVVGLAIHALITGGFPYYHPILMFSSASDFYYPFWVSFVS